MKVQHITPFELGFDNVNEGQRLRAYYNNQGEPYREGCNIVLEIPGRGYPREVAAIFLTAGEAGALRDWLDRFVQKTK